MLDTYDFNGEVWLCHSFQDQFYDFITFGDLLPAPPMASFVPPNVSIY